MTFKDWWENFGSGIRPDETEDTEEFAKRITSLAFEAGKLTRIFRESVICACGDEYPSDSYSALAILLSGKCDNCRVADGDA